MKTLRAAICAGALAAASIAGCGDGGIFDCDDEMDDLVAAIGQPQEVQSYSSSGYSSVTFWYWRRGLAKTFTWGSNVSGGCEESEYRFSPIGIAIQ